MEDWRNFGADYDKTLMAWCNNFDSTWPKLKSKYADQFYRMWKYYLLGRAGTFRAPCDQLWQSAVEAGRAWWLRYCAMKILEEAGGSRPPLRTVELGIRF